MRRKKIEDNFKKSMDRTNARSGAQEAIDPAQKPKHLRLEHNWLRLARTYEFAQRLNSSRIIVWHHGILEAYHSPKFGEEGNDPRTVSLLRHGRYEVRLVELPRRLQTGTKQLWLELFDHCHQYTIDSYSGHHLMDITAAAETLCSKAKELSKSTD